MNRLGMSAEELGALKADGTLARLAPDFVMTHFSASEDPSDPANARQIKAFAAMADSFPELRCRC